LPMIGLGQSTPIFDANFEQALINLGYDTGTPNGSVPTSNINTVDELFISNQNISDLTGIEDFTALTDLDCENNQLTSIIISGVTALTNLNCSYNQLTSLDVSGNTILTDLNCSYNQLTGLDLSNITTLTYLDCDNNQLTSLDISQNTALTSLWCHTNQLTSLDIRNGNNTNMNISLGVQNNPNLSCISVDDVSWSTTNWTVANGNIDPQHSFSTNCNPSSIQEHITDKELLKVTDLLGRETKQTNQPLFYIYDDGTVEKKIIIE